MARAGWPSNPELTSSRDSRRMDLMALLRRLKRLANDGSGATAVEYALIIGAIAGVIAVVVYVLGAKTNNLYNKVNTSDW
ncbi:MAG TPA: Flp family type IVb pilin [Polyangia bacterium]|nr:Flp family type IVb pilin [Polyangia bacterium]